MVSRKWLLALLFTVPLIGFLVAEGVQAYLNSELRAALREQFPDEDPAVSAVFTNSAGAFDGL